jgi:hypothetical protein
MKEGQFLQGVVLNLYTVGSSPFGLQITQARVESGMHLLLK